MKDVTLNIGLKGFNMKKGMFIWDKEMKLIRPMSASTPVKPKLMVSFMGSLLIS